jgi:PEP-CTERM motif
MSRLTRALLCMTALTIAFVALPLTSRAGTITVYNNFGAGNSYDCCNAYTESGAGSFTGFNSLQAMAFTNATGQNIALTQIDIADSFVAGNNSMTLNLYADNGGVPGGVLESWTVNNLPALGTCCAISTVLDSAGVVLQNGSTYWLAPASDNVTWEAWNWNTTGANGNGALSTDGGTTWAPGPYDPNGAFDVLGTAVPEPSAVLLMGTALIGILVGLHLGLRRAA